MSKVKLHSPVAEMHGAFEKNSGIIMRQKTYRAPNGAVLKVDVQEAYKIANPRDFDKTPAKGAELRLRLENYRTRFYAQFKNPDPDLQPSTPTLASLSTISR